MSEPDEAATILRIIDLITEELSRATPGHTPAQPEPIALCPWCYLPVTPSISQPQDNEKPTI